jgi:hypothetical protein
MWAIGRTLNASSRSDVQQSLERADDIDDEKEYLYFQILEASNRYDASAVISAQQYLGPFPKKTDDAERMRLYLNDLTRLCERLQKNG